ncbi:MAG: hypothetical protein HN742_33365 [Lentisphaerae bacterium]|jgi:penicillin-binding protein 2|nr:hypothetical protein [Lentisphaerota bacterium]MBT5611310.1 hypothetical protein [Lentisphaerota bacterium]MBT7054791.1 hypothetical protein [Lentisphaerota bacterium]MBT7846808.1 hypothetical protein [Lentisphaerota bacterium]
METERSEDRWELNKPITADAVMGAGERNPRRVLRMLTLTYLIALGAVAAWLVRYQVVGSPEMMDSYNRQIVRRIHLPPQRGSILDCNEVPIRTNAATFKFVLYLDALVDPRHGRQKCLNQIGQAIVEFAKLFDTPTYRRLLRPESDIRATLLANGPLGLVLNEDFDPSDQMMAIWAVHRGDFPHIRLERRLRRMSTYPNCLVHTAGDIRLEEPIPSPAGALSGHARDTYHLYQKEMRGISGLELACDSVLRGTPGVEEVVVTANGLQRASVISRTDPVPGGHQYTTLDTRLQAISERGFFEDGGRGAFVITTCVDGAIRAIGSAPCPPLRTPDMDWKAIEADPDHPLLNRAKQSLYSPGSTIKPLLAQAFLASGKVAFDDLILCTGKQSIGRRLRGCKRAHGHVNMGDAIRLSCNTYFHRVGMQVGGDDLREWLENAYGCNDSEEAPELALPATTIMSRTGETWRPIENWLLCIGQGATEVSVPVLANAAAALVTGVVCRPHLLRPDPHALSPVSPPPNHAICRLPTTPETRRQVLQGMIDVVHGNPATGRRAKVAGLLIAAKTGTAEKEVDGGSRRINNTLMIALVPARAPVYAIACIVEDGRSGGATVAPRLKKVIEGMLEAGLILSDEEAGEGNES